MPAPLPIVDVPTCALGAHHERTAALADFVVPLSASLGVEDEHDLVRVDPCLQMFAKTLSGPRAECPSAGFPA